MGKTALIAKDDIETDFSSEIIEIELPGGTRGLQGEQGIQGETGKTPNFHIGAVSDTETAVASITGTTDDPVLNLGLPKGKSGVWVGPSEPVDEQYNVWVDPEGTAGTVPTKLSQLTDDVGYSLITETGNKIYLTIDNSNYQLYATLKDKNGNVIDTSNTIDLPLETMVVGASYDSQTKEIVLTLKNGNTTRFSVADLVSGLVSTTYLTTNYYDKATVDSLIEAIEAGVGDGLKVGSIIPFSGSTAPNGYMICDGSAISRTTYASLYSVIGTTYGSGDGSTTFNLPNLKGRVPVGLDSTQTEFDTLGETGGSKELQEHSHSYTTSGKAYNDSATESNRLARGMSNYDRTQTTETTGTGNSGNLQPYITVNYIIKATHSQTGTLFSETLPIGTELDYDGETVPSGWEQTTDPNEYSTSEVKTNKTWIDGKPIYRKVFTGTLASAIDHGLTNVNFVNAYGFYVSSSGTFLPLSSLRPNNSTFNTGFYVTSTQIMFDKGSSASGDCYITLEYTKTGGNS